MSRMISCVIAVGAAVLGGITGLDGQLVVAMAEEGVKQELIRTIPVPAGEADGFEPEQYYEPEAGGGRYRLESWRPVNIPVASHRTQEEVEVVFPDMEWTDKIAEEKEVTVSDEETGMEKTVTLPLLYTEYSDYQWTGGFSFPVVVENWDAEIFSLGEILIPRKEVEPFSGYEEKLLTQIGVDPSFYRILQTEWTGPAYEKNGVWFREARANGEKLVADVTAVYGGRVIWEESRSPAVEAVYLPIAEQAGQAFTIQETVGGDKLDPAVEAQPGLGDWLYNILMKTYLLRISILFLIIVAFVLWYLCKKKKKSCPE